MNSTPQTIPITIMTILVCVQNDGNLLTFISPRTSANEPFSMYFITNATGLRFVAAENP
jgi:hypothetical protein